MNNQKNRNPFLDYLRAISAILVALYHYTCRYDELFTHINSYPFVLRSGGKAVAVFFLLSGYFAINHIDGKTFKQYLQGRFIRLYPIYWISMSITFVLCKLFLVSRAVSIKDYLINFTMIPDLLGANYVDGAYWTLRYELIFYLIIGIICLLRSQQHTGKVSVLWTMFYSMFLAIRHFGFLNFETINKLFSVFLLFNCYGTSFFTGSLVACIEKQLSYKNGESAKRIAVYLFALIINLGLCLTQSDTGYFIYYFIGTMLLIISIILHKKSLFNSPSFHRLFTPLSFIASISFPFYLLHQNIGFIIINQIELLGLGNELFVLFPVAVMLFVSWLLHKYVEKPIVKLLKKIMPKEN